MSNLIDFYEDISDIIESFSEESDRGIVLISAAIVDDTLERLIRKKLLEPEKNEDELFDIPYAPLKTFSAKINISLRLSIINKDSHTVFHKIREIRNEFAHGFIPVSFDDERVISKVAFIVSKYYDYIIDIFIRTLVDEELLKKVKELDDEKKSIMKNVNKVLEIVGPRITYESIFAFIYACLKDKEEKISKLKPDNSDSFI